MRASIIISVKNDKRIQICLGSIFTVGKENFYDEFEVIVIENSPVPVLKNLICDFPVKYYLEPRKGMGYARETGLSHAIGDFIVFTDADCVVAPGWLNALLKPFEQVEVGIVGGPITKYRPETTVEKYQRDLVIGGQTKVQYLLPIYPRPYVVMANAAYRREAVLAAGGIDPHFYTCSDTDLAWRIGDLGYQATIAPNALVFHAGRRSRRAVFRQFYTYSLGHALLFKKFKKNTRKLFCFNSYPFQGLARNAIPFLKTLFARSRNRQAEQTYYQLQFVLIEHIALIVGALAGSIKHRVLYI